jgi:hypothetical protein
VCCRGDKMAGAVGAGLWQAPGAVGAAGCPELPVWGFGNPGGRNLRPHCRRCCCPAATTSRPPSSPSLTAQVRHPVAPGALAAAAQALSAARAWTGGAAEAPRT